jgi:hypothetical protein
VNHQYAIRRVDMCHVLDIERGRWIDPNPASECDLFHTTTSGDEPRHLSLSPTAPASIPAWLPGTRHSSFVIRHSSRSQSLARNPRQRFTEYAPVCDDRHLNDPPTIRSNVQ